LVIAPGTMSLSPKDTDETRMPQLAESLADDSVSPEDDAILRIDYAKARSRILVLAREILGERERIVFQARCMTDIITAMAQEGYGVPQRAGEVLQPVRTRARRRSATLPSHRPKPVPAAIRA
jgi:hypothetical protein